MLARSKIEISPPKVAAVKLSKRFGPVVALEPTDLEVRSGEFLTLLGPSGSGKTTLLQMISGLISPSEGRVFIDGEDHTRTPARKRRVGIVFQNYALFPHMTVRENVSFPLRVRHFDSSEIETRVAAVLDRVKLTGLASRLPRELSGGQQQRVALARCFVYQPSVILMDEPLGALDKSLRDHMQVEIKRLHRELGVTIVYVTHDQEEALALSDRICLMNHARVEQIGPPSEIYANPRTIFAAQFVGLSNILRGEVEAPSSPQLKTPLGTFKVSAPQCSECSKAALLLRPELLRLEGELENKFSGRVVEIIYCGFETRVLVKPVCGEEIITVRLSAMERVPERGAEVSVRWRATDGVLLPWS